MNKETVQKRYSKEYSEDNIRENIYSLINPIGKYDYYATTNILSWFIEHIMDKSDVNISNIKLLDAGCGDGRKSRIICELIGNASNVKSFDLVEEGVNYCKRMNYAIDCRIGNIVNDFPNYDYKFDGIYACCVFMFLNNDDDILLALENIKKNLKDNGLFLWFDTNEKTHDDCWERPFWGFSVTEMDNYALKAGFELVDNTHLFRNIKMGKESISSYYLVDKLGFIGAELVNRIPIFKPTYNARIYKIKQ